jgi:regulator of protease activity HflC (stomatin/prohibitin superfamily)
MSYGDSEIKVPSIIRRPYFIPLMILVMFLIIWACRYTQIKTGNVGVVTMMGQTKTAELPPGVYFPIPFVESIREYTTKEISVSMNDLRPKSSDNLTMEDMDLDIYYSVNPAMVADLLIKYQGDVGEKDGVFTVGESRVTREIRESAFRAVSEFKATTMHTKREEMTGRIITILQEELTKSDPDAFLVTTANVKALVTDKALESSIRARAQVDQDIEAVDKKNELARKEAARLLTEANGIAAANEAIAKSMTPSMERIRLAEIQRDTALALAGKPGNTVLLQGGASPLLNIGK